MIEIIILILRILMVVILYGFITWIFIIIWKSFKGTDRVRSELLEVTLNINQNNVITKRTFRRLQITIGRDQNCDLQLDDHTVSANHCQLYFDKQRWWVTDNGSTNGTLVNGTKIKSPLVLTSGDKLYCGVYEIELIY